MSCRGASGKRRPGRPFDEEGKRRLLRSLLDPCDSPRQPLPVTGQPRAALRCQPQSPGDGLEGVGADGPAERAQVRRSRRRDPATERARRGLRCVDDAHQLVDRCRQAARSCSPFPSQGVGHPRRTRDRSAPPPPPHRRRGRRRREGRGRVRAKPSRASAFSIGAAECRRPCNSGHEARDWFETRAAGERPGLRLPRAERRGDL
jgi:hypothetical protein